MGDNADAFPHDPDETRDTDGDGIGNNADPRWRIVGLGDYNADLKTDLLWRNSVTGTNIMWLMDGHVRLAAGSISGAIGTNWRIVGNGDHNGDGRADILWRSYSTGGDAMWLMNGFQRLSARVIPRVEDADWKVVPVRN
ncbi:MAG: VCBS repeat-containing protein [Pseudomonadota bacterium]|nr:VCBS repeat-containing protein [Pseudomonadota bacterium]